jgi:hypothetical protein
LSTTRGAIANRASDKNATRSTAKRSVAVNRIARAPGFLTIIPVWVTRTCFTAHAAFRRARSA